MDLNKNGTYVVNDLEDVRYIFEYFNDEPFIGVREEKLNEMSEKVYRYGVIVVDVRDGVIQGVISGYMNNHETKTGFINLVVLKHTKGFIVGRTLRNLLRLYINLGEKEGMEYVGCEVDKQNNKSLTLCTRLGLTYSGKETEHTVFLIGKISDVKRLMRLENS